MPGAAIVDVTDHGALGDVKSTTGSILANSSTLTVPQGVFGPGDVGKPVMVAGAGPLATIGAESAVIPLYTTIAGFGPNTVLLNDAASAGVTGALVRWGTDDTASFQAAAQAVQAAGGGELRIPPATYWLFPNTRPLPPANTGAGDFTGLAGVRIIGPGATLLTARPYLLPDPPPDPLPPRVFSVFTFESCRNVEVRGIHVQGHLLAGMEMVLQNAVLVHLFGGCRNVEVAATCTGILAPLMVTAGPRGNPTLPNDYAGDEPLRSRGIRLAVDAVNCGYGAAFQFSGDAVEATLVTNGCYRSYLAYGVRDHRLTINSRNHIGADVLLQAYGGRTNPAAPQAGFGVENISVDYTNRETTSPWMAANGTAAVELGYGDDLAAVHRDIRVRYDVRYNGGARFGPVLRVNNSSTPAFAGVHGLARLRLEGRVEGSGSPSSFDFNFSSRAVSTAGTVRVAFHDLVFSGLTLATTEAQELDLTALADFAEFHNVSSDARVAVRTAQAASVRWVGCRAPALSSTPGDTLPADYVDCVIGSWAEQSTLGKTFRNTTVGGFPLEIERWEGGAHRQAARFVAGPLSSWFDAFRVRHPGAGALYRLHYSVSPTTSLTPPVGPLQEWVEILLNTLHTVVGLVPRELAGVATWSAFMDETGTPYVFRLPVVRSDRFLGLGNPVVEVDLVPGNGYGTVRLRVPGWGGARARGAFRLEVLGRSVRDVVPL